jgi:hypothetical protein
MHVVVPEPLHTSGRHALTPALQAPLFQKRRSLWEAETAPLMPIAMRQGKILFS